MIVEMAGCSLLRNSERGISKSTEFSLPFALYDVGKGNVNIVVLAQLTWQIVSFSSNQHFVVLYTGKEVWLLSVLYMYSSHFGP